MLLRLGAEVRHARAQIIRAGDADIIVAGGMENMTRAPYLVPSGRFGARMGDAQMIDSMVHDGLTDAFNDVHMGITAENVAEEYGITREEQDEFAARASRRPSAPSRQGIFKEEIVPIEVPQKKGEPLLVDNDEHPRAGTTAEALGKLRTAFRKDGGTVTAGNASGRQRRRVGDRRDVGSAWPQERGLSRSASSRATPRSESSPASWASAPSPPSRKALAKVGLGVEDVDLFELNEAFAAQSLAVRESSASDATDDQPARRRDRARPPDRRQRRAHPRHAAARDEARAPAPRRRHAVRRRRPGTGRRDRNGANGTA